MILKKPLKHFYLNLIIVLLIFLIDRFSKIFVIYFDSTKPTSEIYLSKYLNIQLVWNEGIAFGLFSLTNKFIYNILTLIIIFFILVIFFIANKSKGYKKYSFLLILGGAFGNLFDRIFYKAVPDYLDFHIGNFHWFIFNVADIFISIGVILVIFSEIFDNNKNDENKIN